MWKALLIYSVLNFAALGIGGMLMGGEVQGEWYQNLNKAPWTPPGWVFGAAWTTIMVCFSIYMAQAWQLIENKNVLLGLFAIQWLLNVAWNPIFFKYHQGLPGLAVISMLTILVMYFLVGWKDAMGWRSILVLPYAVWLVIATSLNAFILTNN